MALTGFISMDEMYKFLTSVFKVVLTPAVIGAMNSMGVNVESAEALAKGILIGFNSTFRGSRWFLSRFRAVSASFRRVFEWLWVGFGLRHLAGVLQERGSEP